MVDAAVGADVHCVLSDPRLEPTIFLDANRLPFVAHVSPSNRLRLQGTRRIHILLLEGGDPCANPCAGYTKLPCRKALAPRRIRRDLFAG